MRLDLRAANADGRNNLRTFSVNLNGVEQSAQTTGRLVIMADEERGVIAFYRLEPGTKMLMLRCDGELLVRCATGDVRIPRARPL